MASDIRDIIEDENYRIRALSYVENVCNLIVQNTTPQHTIGIRQIYIDQKYDQKRETILAAFDIIRDDIKHTKFLIDMFDSDHMPEDKENEFAHLVNRTSGASEVNKKLYLGKQLLSDIAAKLQNLVNTESLKQPIQQSILNHRRGGGIFTPSYTTQENKNHVKDHHLKLHLARFNINVDDKVNGLDKPINDMIDFLYDLDSTLVSLIVAKIDNLRQQEWDMVRSGIYNADRRSLAGGAWSFGRDNVTPGMNIMNFFFKNKTGNCNEVWKQNFIENIKRAFGTASDVAGAEFVRYTNLPILGRMVYVEGLFAKLCMYALRKIFHIQDSETSRPLSWITKFYQFAQMFLAQSNVVSSSVNAISVVATHLAFLMTVAQTMGLILVANLTIMILYYVFRATEGRVQRIKNKISEAYGNKPRTEPFNQNFMNELKLYFLKFKLLTYKITFRQVPNALLTNVARLQQQTQNQARTNVDAEVLVPLLENDAQTQIESLLNSNPNMLALYNETFTLVQESDEELVTMANINEAFSGAEVQQLRNNNMSLSSIDEQSFNNMRERLKRNIRKHNFVRPQESFDDEQKLDHLLDQLKEIVLRTPPSPPPSGGSKMKRKNKTSKKCI